MLERKKLKSRNHGIPESQSLEVRYRRTYVLNKKEQFIYLFDTKGNGFIVIFMSYFII